MLVIIILLFYLTRHVVLGMILQTIQLLILCILYLYILFKTESQILLFQIKLKWMFYKFHLV